MFIKLVIVLLLLIVAASLLTGQGTPARPSRQPAASRIRPLLQRVAIGLLALGALLAGLHFWN